MPRAPKKVVIGMDIGHSTVKISATDISEDVAIIFPSSVCPAMRISDDGEARKAYFDTVTVDGPDWSPSTQVTGTNTFQPRPRSRF